MRSKTGVLGIKLLVVCQKGSLELLKYLHENGCPWDRRTCAQAAFGGPRVFKICTRKWVFLGSADLC